MRAEVLLPAVKRRLAEVGYYSGEIVSGWDAAAEKAWLMYCERFGLKHTPVPDIYAQEPAHRDTMLHWYSREEQAQIAQGIMPPTPDPPMSLYDVIKMYSEDAPLRDVDDEVIEARREYRGDEPPAAALELDEERRSLESERRRSVNAALKAAKRVVRENVPAELAQFAAEPVPTKVEAPVKRSKKKLKVRETATPDRQVPLLRVRGGD